jgi:hypothetical protein
MTDNPRVVIGDNAPPPHEAHALHIEDLFSAASGSLAAGPIKTDEQEAALDSLLDDVRQAYKDADAQRAAEKKPHDDAAKAVQATWKPLLDRCDAASRAIKAALTPYRDAKQRAKDAAAQKARDEAEAVHQAAQAALRRSSDLEERFAADAQLEHAKKLTAVANRIDRAPTGLRTVYRTEVTDMTAFSRWAWAHRREEYEAFLRDLAEREGRRGPVSIPGMIVHKERNAA